MCGWGGQVYSEDQGRWIHCDSCEDAWDAPLLYSEASFPLQAPHNPVCAQPCSPALLRARVYSLAPSS